MKNKTKIVGLLMVLMLVSCISLAAQEAEKGFDLPLLTTPAGQSPEIDTVNLLVERAGLQYDYCDVPSVDMIEEGVGLGGAEPGGKTNYNYVEIGTDTSEYPEGTPYNTLIFSIGASKKGMGASGLSVGDEVERLEDILSYAEGDEDNEEKSLEVIGVHIGGSSRRGQSGSANERMISAVAPQSDYLIVTSGSNEDGRFTEIAEENDIPLEEIDSAADLVPVLEELFATEDSS